jgi:glutathione synthase/RimK-type ligase-like ATP-grasp enzyme
MSAAILLWGCSGDTPLAALLAELDRRSVAYCFADQRSMHRIQLDCDAVRTTGRMQLDAEVFELEQFAAMYVRPNDLRAVLSQVPQLAADPATQHAALCTERQLYAWAEMTSALVVNRPSAAAANDSKPYQLEQIRSAGFAVPPTLMTTTPEAVHEFIARHRSVICKTAGRSRGITTRLDAEDRARIAAVAHCPTQFQAHIAGTDWRVHVIGEAIHACEIRCGADDYRIAPEQAIPLQIVPATLPPLLAAHCRCLARSLGLTLAGIDLRCSEDGVWYCFEVNPSPVLPYFERATGQPLTVALADLLIHATCRRLH